MRSIVFVWAWDITCHIKGRIYMEYETKLHHRSRWNLLHLKIVHCLKMNYLEVKIVGKYWRTAHWREYWVLREGQRQNYWRRCITRSFVVRTLQQTLLGWWNQGGWDREGMWHACTLFAVVASWKAEKFSTSRTTVTLLERPCAMELFYISSIQSNEVLKPITRFRMLPQRYLKDGTLQNNFLVVWGLVTVVFSVR